MHMVVAARTGSRFCTCPPPREHAPDVPAVELPTVRKRGAAKLRDSGLSWTIGRSDFAESSQLGNVGPAAGVRAHRASLRLYLKRHSYAALTLNSRCMCCVGSGEAQEFGGCGGLGGEAEGVKTHRTTAHASLLDCMYQGFTRAPVFSSCYKVRQNLYLWPRQMEHDDIM